MTGLKPFVLSAGLVLFVVADVSAQASFDLAFGFPIPDPDAEITNIQLFDCDQDGDEEVVAGFRLGNQWWVSLVDTSGGVYTHHQQVADSAELGKVSLFQKGDSTYLVCASERGRKAIVEVYRWEDLALLSRWEEIPPGIQQRPKTIDLIHLSVREQDTLAYVNVGFDLYEQ